MGNTCQTGCHLAPSVYLGELDKQGQLYQQPDKNALQSSHSLLCQPRIIKPIILPNCGRHSKFTIASERKRCSKNFSKLCLKLENQTSQQINMRRILNKTNHIVTLDVKLRSINLGLGKQFVAFITSLKRFKKTPNLQINYANLPYENFPKFCFALKHLKAPKKLNVELWYSDYSSRHHNPAPLIRAIKGSRDLCEFSVKFMAIADMEPKSLERLFSSLKGHKNLQTLSVRLATFTQPQASSFNKAMKSLYHLKLSKICLNISEKDPSNAFEELFVTLTNFAPSLQHLSLGPPCYDGNLDYSIVFSQHLSKFTHLSHLGIRICSLMSQIFNSVGNLVSGLKSMKNLPTNFRVEVSPYFAERNLRISEQYVISLDRKLASPEWTYHIKAEASPKGGYILRECCLENLQPRPFSSLHLDFIGCDRIDTLTSLLDQVNHVQDLSLDFSRVDISFLEKTFESLEKFSSLASLTIKFTRNDSRCEKWIEKLFDLLLIQLPPSVAFLKLCFVKLIHLTPNDVQFIIGSLARLRKIKNLTGLGLAFADSVQFTDQNGIELAKELKQMTQLKEVELSFKGCDMLKDQGVTSLIENLKTMPGLQRAKALFEDCWSVGQSTIDAYQRESKDFFVNFCIRKKRPII